MYRLLQCFERVYDFILRVFITIWKYVVHDKHSWPSWISTCSFSHMLNFSIGGDHFAFPIEIKKQWHDDSKKDNSSVRYEFRTDELKYVKIDIAAFLKMIHCFLTISCGIEYYQKAICFWYILCINKLQWIFKDFLHETLFQNAINILLSFITLVKCQITIFIN